MTDWLNLIGGGFAHMSAPFAIHPLDRKRALTYRAAAQAAGLEWSDVLGHLEAYSAEQRWTEAKVAEERERLRKFMKRKISGVP